MFPIIKLSNKESAELFNWDEEESRMNSISIGGFAAIYINEETYNHYKLMIGCEKKTANLFSNGFGNYIIVNTDLVDAANYTNTEYNAILEHEMAHHHFGHTSANASQNASGVVCVEAFELEADNYAANIFGKEVVKSAILKTINNIVREAKELGAPESVIEGIKNNSILCARLAALSN